MDWYVVDKKYIAYLTQLKYNHVEFFRSFHNEKEKKRLYLFTSKRKSSN